MEQSLEQVLMRHVAAARDHPDVQERLTQLDETRADQANTMGTKPWLM